MKFTARLVPWSSVVGTGVVLLDDTGRCVGQLALHNVAVAACEDRKTIMLEIAQAVADAIDGRHPTSGVFTDDCDHPQINKATEHWNICPDCGQTWRRD